MGKFCESVITFSTTKRCKCPFSLSISIENGGILHLCDYHQKQGLGPYPNFWCFGMYISRLITCKNIF